MPGPDPQPALVRALAAFGRRFGGRPEAVARAPGRVNLVGEHVDYSEGLVLPMAIDLDCVAAVRRSADGRWRAWSEELRSLADLPDPSAVAEPPLSGRESWANILLGVMAGFVREGVRVPPLEIAVAGDVPLGAGLSSSAALAVAVATAVADVLAAPLFGLPLARLCQEAESRFGGVPCGIMDHVCSVLGKEGHALLIDCRTLDVRFVPFPPESGAALLALDSGIRRSLADGRYAARRREVEDAARAAGVRTLRDLDEQGMRALRLPEPLARRAQHVVREIQRAQSAAGALRRGDLELFGMFMAQSHQSLRDDFEVSTPELDALVDAARGPGVAGGVFGARLTGAGFGGSAIALVDAGRTGISERVAAECARRLRRPVPCRRVRAGPGASVLPPTRWPTA